MRPQLRARTLSRIDGFEFLNPNRIWTLIFAFANLNPIIQSTVFLIITKTKPAKSNDEKPEPERNR